MTRGMWASIVALIIVHAGCGGGSSQQQRESTTASAQTRSLIEILDPLGEHRTPEQLADIAAFIHRWEQDPEAPVPENRSQHSTAFLMLAWLTESPDITVIVSPELSQLGEGRGADIGSMTTMGSTFGRS